MGRVSREQASINRERVIETASVLFRRRGVAGTNLADLMAEAGLTHGGFYKQFGSKDDLAGEACAAAFERSGSKWQDAGGDGEGRLSRLVNYYMTRRDCPMATLAGDAARSAEGSPLRKAFSEGLERLAKMVRGDAVDDRPLAVFSALVGAAVLRSASDNSELSDAIDVAVRSLAATVEREPRPPVTRVRRSTGAGPS